MLRIESANSARVSLRSRWIGRFAGGVTGISAREGWKNGHALMRVVCDELQVVDPARHQRGQETALLSPRLVEVGPDADIGAFAIGANAQDDGRSAVLQCALMSSFFVTCLEDELRQGKIW